MGVGQGLQQDALQHAEDDGVGADAERQGQHRHRGRARVPRQRPQAVAGVLHEVLEQADLPGVAALLLDPPDAAERPARRQAGLLGRHPRGQVLVDLALEMEAELVAQLAVDALALEERSEPQRQLVAPAHRGQLPSRTRSIAADRRRQLTRSASR